ncbi:uncharacterized protein LOC144128348 isoform X2 [Amblyomma americanum]
MHHDDQQLTNDLSASPDDAMESLTDNTAVGSSPADGHVNPAFVSGHGDEPNHLRRSNQSPAYIAQKSIEEEKNAVNQQQQNGKILNHHRIQIPEDAVINYDTARTRKSLQARKSANGDVVALDVFTDSAKAQEALMGGLANGGAGSEVSSPLTGSTAATGDAGTKMFEEYFIPVNTHKKFLRGEKLYLTKEKRKVCSGWKRMFFCCLLLMILGIAVLVGVLAATGFLLSESKSSPKSVHVDPSSPSMYAGSSTSRGAPQPKETTSPPYQQSLPPSSPPVVVISTTTHPTMEPTRPPASLVTDPHQTSVTTATSTREHSTTTSPAVTELTTDSETSTSEATSTFRGPVESPVTERVPVTTDSSTATTDTVETDSRETTTLDAHFSGVLSTTPVPTTMSVPSASVATPTSTETPSTESPKASTETTTSSPIVGVPEAATEAPTTTEVSTTVDSTAQASVAATDLAPTTTSVSATSGEAEPGATSTEGVTSESATTPGATESATSPESTTTAYEATMTSVTEPSSQPDFEAVTTTSSTMQGWWSTVTEPVTTAGMEERTPTEHFPVPAPNAVVGEITLPDEVFSESLNNRSSTEARTLSNQLKQALEDILKGHGYRYEAVDILKYRKGSVVASFVVVGGDLPAAKVKGAIRDFLARNNGTLRGRPVDSESVVAKDVTNWCKVDNMGCVDSVCEWDYLNGTRSCLCLPGMKRLNETACAPEGTEAATTVDEETGRTTLLPITDVTQVTSEHPMTAVESTTPAEDTIVTALDYPTSESATAGSTTTATPATTSPSLSSVTTVSGAAQDPVPTTSAPITDLTTTAVEETTTPKSRVPPATLVMLATTTAATTTAYPASEQTTLGMETTEVASLPTTTQEAMPAPSAVTAQSTEPTTTMIPSTEQPLVTEAENSTVPGVYQPTATTSPTEANDIINATMSLFTTADSGTTLNATTEAIIGVTTEETAASDTTAEHPSTTDIVMFTTTPMTSMSTNETTSTPSVSTDTTTEEPTTVTFSVTVPPVMVFSAPPATSVDNATDSTPTTTMNSTFEETTTTTQMSSVYRDIDGEPANATDGGEFNATISTTVDPTFVPYVNDTMTFNVTDSPGTTISQVETGTDVSMTTTMAPNMNETEPMNVTVTHPGFSNGSSIEEVDADVNVTTNRTFAMGRNLTYNNTLSEDGADVVNSTLDSWNMTAAGTLLNAANLTFGDDNGTSMVTESDITTHVSMTTTQFLNESMANSTEDIFKAHCSSEEFYCAAEGSHTCLKNNFLCDQFEDCPGALDEQNCTDTCGVNFQCKDTTCVMASAKCDGIRDCPEGEDEHNCDIVDSTCSDLEVMCPDSSACIKPLSLCDGIYNCRDRSDESGCVDKTLCEQSNKFYCGDKLCIPSALRCDGHEDCKDGEDEVNCTCGENQFQCMNGFCVSAATGSVRCNGVADCADGSDERGCVQVDNNGIAQAFDGDLGSWTLMCADNATLNDGHHICQEIGFSRAISIRTVKVEANATSWGSWSTPDEGVEAIWSKGLSFSDSCHHGALAVRCDYFECENQTEVLFRIEGEATGQSTQNDVWPYLALLHGNDSEIACHGEIVSPLWVLTTAYCLQQLPQNLSQLYVQAGFARPASARERHRVLRTVLHPHYSQFRSRTLPDYDLALVRLAEPLSFANHVASAVCLPDDVARPGVTCFVGSLGHGKPRVPFKTASSINHLPIVINELTTCNSEEHYKNDVSQKMICGDGRQIKRQLCDGDLGAPLMCLSPNNIWRLAGVVSYQRHCGAYQKHPSVFSNIYEMRDFIHNVTGLLSYNVTHDSHLYSLLEFPQADDRNASAAVRSYAAGKMAGLEHNASAIAAALYSHENILGERGDSANMTTMAPTTTGHDHTLFDLADGIPQGNHTIDSVLDMEEGGNVTTPMAPTTRGAGVEARLQDADSLGADTTPPNSTDVSNTTTTVEPERSMAALRLMDADDSGEVSSNETSRDASSASHYPHHHAAVTNETRIEGRGRSALLWNRTVHMEMQTFREQNSAEETGELDLAENRTLDARMTTTTGIPEEVIDVSTHDYARLLLQEEGIAANESTLTVPTSTSSPETTTTVTATSWHHESHASLTTDNGTTTVAPERTSNSSAAQNFVSEDPHVITTEAAVVMSPPEDVNSTLDVVTSNSTCLGFTCNSDKVCVDHTSVCDGSYDCKDASDEINCVQLKDTVVEGRKKGGAWMPACGDTWDDMLSDSACQGMGFEKASQTSIIALESPYAISLRHSNTSDKMEVGNILKALSISNDTCNTMVTMKCHHYQCGRWNTTLAAPATDSSKSASMETGHTGHWPSIGVLSSGEKRCAAHLISNRWLLTSASCLDNSNAGSWTFKFHQVDNKSSKQDYLVSDILLNHNPNTSQQADIALVRIKNNTEALDKVIPICLPGKEVEPKRNCVIAGFTTSNEGHVHHLSFASLHVVDTMDCHSNDTENSKSVLCAQNWETRPPLCQLAADAALMCTDSHGLWELRGWIPASSVQRLCTEHDGSSRLHAIHSASIVPSVHWVLDIVGHGLAK